MGRVRTWNIRRWDRRPKRTVPVRLVCPFCGTDADMDVAEMPDAKIIAAIGLGLIFDPPSFQPPENFMPDEVKCRHCRKIFSTEENPGVR